MSSPNIASLMPALRAVARDAIGTAVGHAHGEINHLLGHRIERARRHDVFDALPGALERRRIVRKIFPEIVHVFDAARALDVIIDGADFRRGVGMFDGPRNGHEFSLACYFTSTASGAPLSRT